MLFQLPKNEPEILDKVQERLSALKINYDYRDHSVNWEKKIKKFCRNYIVNLFLILGLTQDDISIPCCPMSLPCWAGINSECSLHWVDKLQGTQTEREMNPLHSILTKVTSKSCHLMCAQMFIPTLLRLVKSMDQMLNVFNSHLTLESILPNTMGCPSLIPLHQ